MTKSETYAESLGPSLLTRKTGATHATTFSSEHVATPAFYAGGVLTVAILQLLITGGMRCVELVPRTGPLLSMTWAMGGAPTRQRLTPRLKVHERGGKTQHANASDFI